MKDLQPTPVWNYFDEILKIPRLSRHEEKILEYLEKFAANHQLETQKDRAGNMIIRKQAQPGFEDREKVVLQSHVDMVGEKLAEVEHDFHRDPIEAVLDEGWVKAKGTTLGADDGIGIAASLAVLASKEIKHGPLECLFTVDEETGMTGAFGLQPGFLEGKILLNLDSEDEGEIFIGCAGGIDTLGRFKTKVKRIPRHKHAFKIGVTGLRGGHSGDEIHKGFGNAIKLLNRFLWNADKRFTIRIASFEGGKLRNAIPREATATLVLTDKTANLLRIYFESYKSTVSQELAGIEPGFDMIMEEVTNIPEFGFTRKFQRTLMNMIYACPHGVIGWSSEIDGLVETSTNLAVMRMNGDEEVEILTSQRSSVESAKRDIADRISALFQLAGGDVIHSDGYPGWKPDPSSRILEISEKIYKELFNEKPEVKAIHAGLECGLFLEKYPELDMISFGPTILGAHTPDERLDIETVKKFWDFLLKILEETPEKK